jgi:hypothetical protein
MADAGLFIGWGQTVRGREAPAVEVFNQAVAYYQGLERDGKVEDVDIVVLEPHGGDLAGFILLKGSEEQMAAVQRDDDFQRLMGRSDLVVDNIGVVRAFVGESMRQLIALREASIEDFGD